MKDTPYTVVWQFNNESRRIPREFNSIQDEYKTLITVINSFRGMQTQAQKNIWELQQLVGQIEQEIQVLQERADQIRPCFRSSEG